MTRNNEIITETTTRAARVISDGIASIEALPDEVFRQRLTDMTADWSARLDGASDDDLATEFYWELVKALAGVGGQS